MKFFDSNKKNALKKLQQVLDSRKLKQQNKSKIVKRLLLNVKKYGDSAVIKYEKKFSRVKVKVKNIL